MKKTIGLLFLFLIGLMANGQTLRTQFNEQVKASCGTSWIYAKQVTASPNPTEKKSFALQCSENKAVNQATGETLPFQFSSELVYTVEYAADDPFQKEFFNLSHMGSETLYQRKAESASDTPLEFQRVILDARGTIREIETRIHKQNWLYSLRISTVVRFDEAGKYQSHELKTENDVIFSGLSITEIKGWREK